MMALLNKRLAWIATGLGIALWAGNLVISYSPDGIWYTYLIYPSLPFIALLVGGLITIRLPGNIYGWLWIALGWGAGVLQPWGTYLAGRALEVSPPRVRLAGAAVEIAAVGWLLVVAMVSLTFLLYPTGRPPSPRWRILVWIVAVAASLATLSSWAVPGLSGIAGVENPFGIRGTIGRIAGIISIGSVLILFISVLLATLSLLFRYRRAAGLERAQLRWLASAAALNIAVFIIDTSEIHKLWVNEETMTSISNALLLTLPLAVAIAILRYRLWDIDLVIRRTLVYGVLTGILALVFFGGVALLQQVVGRISGTEDSPVIIVISTLLIAALFSPLRRRLQDFIDQRFYRQKYNAEQALADFAEAARSETDLEALTGKLVEVVSQTMQPESLTLWLNSKANPTSKLPE